MRKLLEIVSVSKVAQLPTWTTLDYWKMPISTPLRQRLKIALAGPLAGIVAAWAIFTILAVSGMPELFSGQYVFSGDASEVSDQLLITSVAPGSGADNSGIRPNDAVITIGSEHVRSAAHFAELNEHFEGRNAVLVTDGTGDSGVNVFVDPEHGSGVELQNMKVTKYGIAAPFVGLVTTVQLAWLSLLGLLGADTGLANALEVFSSAHYFGFRYLLYLLAYALSIYSFFNLIPFRPFDMGRVVSREGFMQRLWLRVRTRQQP